jgi:EAL domain-containing protein (putative c-di-GMP-specific phosphodiesterase class I)
LLAPAEFLAAAEGSSLIQPLTLAVIDKALRFCRGWLDQGVRLPVAVNVSGRSVFRADFPALIKDRLAHAQVAGDLLTIELNEGSAMSFPAGAVDVLTQLRAMGVRLSVDDYGTGYSSMAYLKDLPVNELKIDREFVAGLIGDHRDAVIVRSAITLSHDLGLSIVAEGVEDPATLAALEELGVDVAQGFHLGRPMSEDLIPAWIAARQHRVA